MISPDDLTEEQKQLIHTWAAEGLELGDIQSRLSDDHGLKATYMEMHLLMIDLKVEFPDEEEEEPEPEPEPAAPAAPGDATTQVPPAAPAIPADAAIPAEAAATDAAAPAAPADAAPAEAPPGAPPSPEDLPNVTVTLSDLARPGTMAGGQATFDNGETAEWYMDELGRLGMNPANPEFKPSEAQIMAFQVELQKLARARGF